MSFYPGAPEHPAFHHKMVDLTEKAWLLWCAEALMVVLAPSP